MITNIAIASDKITVTNDDGTTKDFVLPSAPAQEIDVHVGETIEIKGV